MSRTTARTPPTAPSCWRLRGCGEVDGPSDMKPVQQGLPGWYGNGKCWYDVKDDSLCPSKDCRAGIRGLMGSEHGQDMTRPNKGCLAGMREGWKVLADVKTISLCPNECRWRLRWGVNTTQDDDLCPNALPSWYVREGWCAGRCQGR
jgi:hypothetical protein